MASNRGFSLRGFYYNNFFVVIHKPNNSTSLPKVYQWEVPLESIRKVVAEKGLDWSKIKEEDVVDLHGEVADTWLALCTDDKAAPLLGRGGFAVVYYVSRSGALRIDLASKRDLPKTLASTLFRSKYGCPARARDFQHAEVHACCFHVSLPRKLRDNDLSLSEPVGHELHRLVYEQTHTQLPLHLILTLCIGVLDCYKCLRAQNLMHGDLTLNNFVCFSDKVLMIDLDSLVSVDPKSLACTNIEGNHVAMAEMNGTPGYCSSRPPGTSPFEEDAFAVLWVVQNLVSRIRLSIVERTESGTFTIGNILPLPVYSKLLIWIYDCNALLEQYIANPLASKDTHNLETFVAMTLKTLKELQALTHAPPSNPS